MEYAVTEQEQYGIKVQTGRKWDATECIGPGWLMATAECSGGDSGIQGLVAL